MKILNERHNYGLELFLLSIDEGITGYRDDSLEVRLLAVMCTTSCSDRMLDSKAQSRAVRYPTQDTLV